MKAHIYSSDHRALGYVEFGAGDLEFAQAALRAHQASLPLPPLESLQQEARVYGARGQRVGAVNPITTESHYWRAEVTLASPSGGRGHQRIGVVSCAERTANLWRYDTAAGDRGHDVGQVTFTSDLAATVTQHWMHFGRSARAVGLVRLDAHLLLVNRLVGGGNPLWIERISFVRPTLYAGGAALLLLLDELGS